MIEQELESKKQRTISLEKNRQKISTIADDSDIWNRESILIQVRKVLEDLKAQQINLFDMRNLVDWTDWMVILSGTSRRHVHAIAEKLVMILKQSGVKPVGIEGLTESEWVLIDFGHVVVHVMLPEARTFYNLESLWGMS